VNISERIGRRLAHYLDQPRYRNASVATCKTEELASIIKKGDVLLVEGNSRISNAVKYLTQSTWSHAALCISDKRQTNDTDGTGVQLLEADVQAGVRLIPLSEYWHSHTRICRPVGLTDHEIDKLVNYACSRLGNLYDLKNIFDLARYLIQSPPVPDHWKRRMLALGSGDPTRAICSSLIAQSFQSVHYPILPDIEEPPLPDNNCHDCYREILHIRHHSLFAPRDFDISPYFQIIKPTLQKEFDPHVLTWAKDRQSPADTEE
jgi:hypothetical protein